MGNAANSGMLTAPLTSKIVERCGNRHFQVATVSMQGWRCAMEDAHITECKDTYGLFGIFDGHVGRECSKYCATNMPPKIAALKPPLKAAAVQKVVEDLDTEFMTENPKLCDGCTATFLIATPASTSGKWNLQVGNVGDSRIVLCQSGNCVPLTEDHKPSLPHETERIVAAGGFVENDRVNGQLAVSRAMGDRDYKCTMQIRSKNLKERGEEEYEGQAPKKAKKDKSAKQVGQLVVCTPEIRDITCESSDWILLCCDGIFEPASFPNEEVIKFVSAQLQKSDDPAAAVTALCTEALKRGSTDNMTAMLVRFKDGSSYGPHKSYWPGPYSAESAVFRKAYAQYAHDEMGYSVGKTLELRYDHVTARRNWLKEQANDGLPEMTDFKGMKQSRLIAHLTTYGNPPMPNAKKSEMIKMAKAEWHEHTYHDEVSVPALEAELKHFAGGPPANLSGEAREKWFSTKAEEFDEKWAEHESEEDLEIDPNDYVDVDEETLLRFVDKDTLAALREQFGDKIGQDELDAMDFDYEPQSEKATKKKKKGAKGAKAKVATEEEDENEDEEDESKKAKKGKAPKQKKRKRAEQE